MTSQSDSLSVRLRFDWLLAVGIALSTAGVGCAAMSQETHAGWIIASLVLLTVGSFLLFICSITWISRRSFAGPMSALKRELIVKKGGKGYRSAERVVVVDGEVCPLADVVAVEVGKKNTQRSVYLVYVVMRDHVVQLWQYPEQRAAFELAKTVAAGMGLPAPVMIEERPHGAGGLRGAITLGLGVALISATLFILPIALLSRERPGTFWEGVPLGFSGVALLPLLTALVAWAVRGVTRREVASFVKERFGIAR